MRVASTLVITLVVILNSIELSSQSDNFHPDGHLSSGRPPSPERLNSHGASSSAGRSEEDLRRTVVMKMYHFPVNSDLLTKMSRTGLRPLGNIPYPALITGTGFVVARIDKNTAIVRGIYNRNHRRVKVNANTDEIVPMEPDEYELYPVNRVYNVPSTLILGGTYDRRRPSQH